MTKQDNAAKKAARRDASPHHSAAPQNGEVSNRRDTIEALDLMLGLTIWLLAAWLFLAATPDQTTACDREEAREQ